MSHVKNYPVEVEGVGDFVFRHRDMRAEMNIGAEYSRYTLGVETPTQYLSTFADMLATLKVLTVSAPDGWDLDAMDPLEVESYKRILAVFTKMREKEEFFRKAPRQ